MSITNVNNALKTSQNGWPILEIVLSIVKKYESSGLEEEMLLFFE